MTAPIRNSPNPQPEDVHTSLCYEVHGEADKFFSLISDECTAVNAHYARAPINSPIIDLNVVDSIGVRTVGDDGACHNIQVDLSDCQAKIDEVYVTGTYQRGGISIREFSDRVRIVVPNCADDRLVMWVFCTEGMTEDEITEEKYNFHMIRFMVTRGLNLNELSHGIIGKQRI